MVSGEGSGSRSSSARLVMSIPGVQNPHCRPWQVTNPSCTGSSSGPWARPSTVSTDAPSAITASTVQDFTGTPSRRTTQAPQFVVSQPQCVPVRPSSSRRRWVSSSRGSMSRVYCPPLTRTVISMSGLPSGACRGTLQRPGHELGDQRPLVVDGAALVGGRRAVLGGNASRLGEGLVGGRPAAEGVLGLGGDEVRRTDGGEPDAHLGDRVAGEGHDGPG